MNEGKVLPNGTEISRILSKDLILSGYLVPAGTHVNMNQSVLYRSEQYFESPDKFLPERWLRGKQNSNIHPYMLIPFGVKARTCAGRRFAEQDLMVLLAFIINNFKLECHLEHPLKQVYHTLLFPEEPLGILFKARKDG
ncbi:hypothetical protein J437_LFUL017122 [Ladona fulva]|uniref:Cytochrome P450 n=1 Tax=Ladona fulva TaxID=123851 RepID=A0A8K0P9F3_LADFU|nr:hypothetical protein J437_LFUL017122 [Ladona fulva]